ncbi:MAG: TatD family hydrolase [Candidatus Aenigmatarchaeota archaeon]|nr:TatD family hydrolase [Candidatus Aenigmarchaeota archaeon]
MIDVHCHLEQEDYEKDRDEVIERCKKELKAIITSCAHPKDLEKTIEMVKKHEKFVFASVGIHPEYIGEFSEKDVESFIEKIRRNKEFFVAIGEVGLDFNWVKDKELQERQKNMFKTFIDLSKELDLPLVVHSRDAMEETIRILEEKRASKVHLHLFGEHSFLKNVIKNGWFISIGPIVLRSKKHKKIARDMLLERIMLETDSPWFGFGKRNDPTSIKDVANKIAEIKKISFDEVWKVCGENAIRFFNLDI